MRPNWNQNGTSTRLPKTPYRSPYVIWRRVVTKYIYIKRPSSFVLFKLITQVWVVFKHLFFIIKIQKWYWCFFRLSCENLIQVHDHSCISHGNWEPVSLLKQRQGIQKKQQWCLKNMNIIYSILYIIYTEFVYPILIVSTEGKNYLKLTKCSSVVFFYISHILSVAVLRKRSDFMTLMYVLITKFIITDILVS